MLEVERLSSGYGKLMVLHDISLSVAEREIVVMLGANGAGKSTLLRTLSGLIAATGGSAHLTERSWLARRLTRSRGTGICHVPEGRGIFAEQSVQDNLELGAFGWARAPACSHGGGIRPGLWTCFRCWPNGGISDAGTLSGGQQQIVAIGRALMARPKLVLLDEPSLGLALLVVTAIFDTIRRLRDLGIGDPSRRTECASGPVISRSRLRAQYREDCHERHRNGSGRKSSGSAKLSWGNLAASPFYPRTYCTCVSNFRLT